ncbi:hypothetical protein GCM10010994_05260 [Chelatococcus reniformis]|uniref:Serine protease n=2 Tax=Chelatococcus reniformis TaxID=1494448 RepID=A0A916X6Z1_9HYPH|nr:hypothetical protein GCM10010994_05260 [Chelatococcus reniformis]
MAALLALAGPATAAPGRAPAGFEAARFSFETQLTLAQRLDIQVLLIAAGYLNAVPIEGFSMRTFAALQRAAVTYGLPPTGVVTAQLLAGLRRAANPMFDLWGFERVRHPWRPVSIWVPLGLGLEVNRSVDGVVYHDRQRRLILGFLALRAGIGDAYAAANAELARDGATVHYRVFKDGWYVISATSRGGLDQYQRFHQDGPYVTGFRLTWNNANGNVSGERIAILTSASLWSRMTGAPFVEPPYRQPQMVSRPEPPAVPTPPPAASSPVVPPPAASPAPPAPSAAATKEVERLQSGTGFFVTADGSLVTNAHVVEGCTAIRVRTDDGAVQEGRLMALDAANDLALLKVATAPPAKVASLRAAVRLGEGVAAFGFPHANLLSTSGNFTLGNVTALSGLADDIRFVQVSTPVQAGNSGGPLLDQSGNVVGVVTAKLNAIKVALASGDLPQNVNFALKASILGTFLEANRVVYDAGSVAPKALEPADIAERARAISAMVSCR